MTTDPLAQKGGLASEAAVSGGGRLRLVSMDCAEGDRLPPSAFGPDGRSIGLRWAGAPSTTQTYAVVVESLGVPTMETEILWLVSDLPPRTTRFPAGAGDAGSVLIPREARTHLNSRGSRCYEGPHAGKRGLIRFRVLALSNSAPTVIGLDSESAAATLEREAAASASLVLTM